MINKKLVVIIVLVAMVLILAFVAYKSSRDGERTYEEVMSSIKPLSYSLSGKILSINSNGFVIQAGWIENKDGQNVFVQHERKVVLGEATHVYEVTLSSRKVVPDAGAKYFKVGESVVVYTADNPADNETLNATRIDVNRSK